MPYVATIEHDGRAYRIEIPQLAVPRCANCHAISIDDEADREISIAFRRAAGLLIPEEIRVGRENFGLTQRAFADLMQVSEATVVRWESGAQIQQGATDQLLRARFATRTAV